MFGSEYQDPDPKPLFWGDNIWGKFSDFGGNTVIWATEKHNGAKAITAGVRNRFLVCKEGGGDLGGGLKSDFLYNDILSMGYF